MIKLLHFADAHIDMANYGRHDPESGLPMRVIDFLNSLDEIIRTAIDEKVDLVIFAGDAYKDRSPAPTFQREWDRRIMQLSHAGIPTVLLTGNHDISPSTGRAHAIQEFDSLNVPHVYVIDRPKLLLPDDIEGLPVQILCIPWLSHSEFVDTDDPEKKDPKDLNRYIQTKLGDKIQNISSVIDLQLPLILAAHASVEGVEYGSERLASISKDFVLDKAFVTSEIFDYASLGHIHKYQDLNEGKQPPAIYPGSIERVDFGEEQEKKYFVIAKVEKGNTSFDQRELRNIRKFITKTIEINDSENVNFMIKNALPTQKEMKGSIVRLIVSYKTELEPLINDSEIIKLAESAFEFQFIKKPVRETRARIPRGEFSSGMSVDTLLEGYFKATEKEIDKEKLNHLKGLASEILGEIENPD